MAAEPSVVIPDRAGTNAGRDASPRTVRRRRTLPSGRAVVGGFLVAAAALGIYAAWAQANDAPTEQYVIAARDLPVGTRITKADLALAPMDLPARVAGHAAFKDPARLVGTTVVGAVRADELVQAGDVVRGAAVAGTLEVSFSLDAPRAVGGTLAEGDTVDVDATFGAGADTYTATVVKQAQVVRAAQRGTTLGDGRTVTVTLAVRSRTEALAVSHAVATGEVTLVRTTGVDLSADGADTYRAPAKTDQAER